MDIEASYHGKAKRHVLLWRGQGKGTALLGLQSVKAVGGPQIRRCPEEPGEDGCHMFQNGVPSEA